jgi:DNA repair exonuclease SbcCD ATPase subunit
MTGGSKIIGMWKDREENTDLDPNHVEETENEDTLELGIGDRAFSPENESVSAESAEDEWSEYYEAEPVDTATGAKIEIATVSILAALWTGFFLWSNRDIFTTLIPAQTGVELLSQWSMPIILLGVFHLLFMRNSTKETSRFADAASSLRTESEQLELRLKTVNNELTIAREFLANETRELEFLGTQSSQKLSTAADLIKTSLENGLSSMRKLDEVGESAFNNLDQLREHLPVVINTAKDVTNQIGNTGRASQDEMAAMVATLKKVGEAGTSAKQSIDGLTESSNQSLTKLSELADEIQTSFTNQFSDAENETQRISKVLQNNANEVIEALRSTRAELASETAGSAQSIKSDLEVLETTLANLGKTADEEETRLKSLIDELQQRISEINEDVSSLDNESGEKTAKLAFALKALEENNQSLQDNLEQGHGIADGMIERMEKLLEALDSSTREMDETVPAALERVDQRSQTSLIAIKKLNKEAVSVGKKADAISEQVEQTNASLENQTSQLIALKDKGSSISDELLSQIDTLATQLKDVQIQNEELAESASEKLITALLRVKETAKQASEYSRETLEKSITGSAERFEQISEETLNRVVDEKIGSIAPKLEEAVASAVATTESTAGHLAGQLNAIEEMTTQLEQRILFAKEKAEQSSEENFTRRVALLTESLNSTAIDVSKILSNDVTDTEWAAYLKGDRGIFTRRAVRLLDNGEVREILAQYEANDEFREHVNRYIHDFEAMLRGVLSTRDGSAISVTLLSSDIGKLYVALAQAIERLRT